MTKPPFLQTLLFPIPSSVKARLSWLASLSEKGGRVLLSPDTVLGVNLHQRGVFSGMDIIGLLDRDSKKAGQIIANWKVFSYDELDRLRPNAVIITSLRHHDSIAKALLPLARQFHFEVIDLCEDFNPHQFRNEVAEVLSGLLWPCQMSDTPKPQNLEIRVPDHWGFGDKLCALSAARIFARRNPHLQIHFNLIPEVMAAFDDDLVSRGQQAVVMNEFSTSFHREKHSSIALNYLGCYVLGLGLSFDTPPALELPNLSPLPGLKPGTYCVLQPRAGWARPNLKREQLSRLAAQCPLPVFLAGRPGTGLDIPEASEQWLGDELTMLRLIQHAGMVLAPRSASAHIAAGYRVPSVIWIPDDGENWHLDYPNWEHRRVPVKSRGVVRQILMHVDNLLNSACIAV